jgi:2-keto-4-pentenoate hydratase/2-oxohepta-3-ene-1,7-dioic acid hydratase in catechol pathway
VSAGIRWARFCTNEGSTGFGTYTDAGIAVYDGDLFAGARPTGVHLARDEFTLQCPCTPSKIIALWNNFHELCAKLGKQPRSHPQFLIKPATCVIGPDEAIRRPKSYAGKVAFEGELGIVIGARCKDLAPSQASAAIFGYTCVNDVTAIGILGENADFEQWCRAKGFDSFGCLGPVIATALDFTALRVITRLNGDVRQDYAMTDMVIAPAEVVSRVSCDMTLLPGDVIACGTSLGVGSMKEGSGVEVSIDGIGVLRNTFEPALPDQT